MDKRGILKLNNGNIESGFSASLQIGNEGMVPEVEIAGSLPAAPELKGLYQRWQMAYRHLGFPSRIEAIAEGYVTNVSIIGDCQSLATELAHAFNQWLRAETFRPIQEKLLERLTPQDTIRLILQTPYGIVQRLPWHLWEIGDRYPKLEITLSAPTYQKATDVVKRDRTKIRILAIIGHSPDLDIATDQALLNHLTNVEIKYLIQPDRATLNTYLWDTKGWDILFFAGHSTTKAGSSNQATGYFRLNETTTLTIDQLRNALRRALTHGLKIAIFNSCDGLGLAQALTDLQISQVLVMREPVPDKVAHAFLKSFLTAFSQGSPLILAVREAREKLQGIEDKYPCAAWLPTLYQNPAEIPPTWQTLLQPSFQSTPKRAAQAPDKPTSLAAKVFVQILTIGSILTLRALGLFQPLETQAFDWFTRLRPKELPDDRIVVITVTNQDFAAQNPETRGKALSDSTLETLLNRINAMEPRLIGLDIYRDYPVQADQPKLANLLKNQDNFYAVCKGSDQDQSQGLSPPEEVPLERVGFTDFVPDADEIIRRQLYYLNQEPTSPCPSTFAFSMLMALRYLDSEGLDITVSEDVYHIGKTALRPLSTTSGGYRKIDAKGYQLLLNYRNLESPEQIAETITLSQLLEGDISPEVIRDRIVLISSKVEGFYDDNWETPYGTTQGVFMQAHMISQLISAVMDDRALLGYWPEWGEILWILFWAGTGSVLAITLRSPHKPTLTKLALGLLASELALFGLCWLLFAKGHIWVPWASAAIAPLAVVASTPTTKAP